MCGATQSQTDLENQQAAFYQQATQEATTTYGEDQALLQQMQSVYDPILAKGPNQKGFSTEEEQGLNAQAVEGTAENYAGAAKSVNENLAAEGGGTNPLPSGGQEQLKEQVAESAAQTESSEEEQIQQADYAEGSRQFGQATAALEDVSGQYNPTAYSGAATGAGSAASTTANDIAEQSNSWVNAAIGAAGQIGGAAVALCPAKGMRFLMADGTEKPVEMLQVGESLAGIDGESVLIEEIQTAEASVLRIETEDGCVLICSRVHAFALPVGGFAVALHALEKTVLTGKGHSKIVRVEPFGTDEVFNIITDGSHTYRAEGMWSLGVGEAERQVNMKTWDRIGQQMAGLVGVE
jgi:hypothetical protein